MYSRDTGRGDSRGGGARKGLWRNWLDFEAIGFWAVRRGLGTAQKPFPLPPKPPPASSPLCAMRAQHADPPLKKIVLHPDALASLRNLNLSMGML